MPDILDHAQKIEEQSRTHAIEHALSSKEKPLYEDGQRICLDCMIPVPLNRVAVVNAVRCIECQTLNEVKAKQLGG